MCTLTPAVAFYLGDSNLPYDKYLFEKAQQQLSDAEQRERPGTGWIDLTHLSTFKRMRPYAALGDDRVPGALRKAIAAAPADAPHLLEIQDDGKSIRRTRPIAQDSATGQLDRSVYAKGFGDEAAHLQERIENFFERYGAINAVRMRREGGNGPKSAGKPFKGSVFVEFASEAEAKAFVALSPAPTFRDDLGPLEVLSKRAYIDKKALEHAKEPKYTSTPQNRPFSAFRELKLATKVRKEIAEADLEITHDGKTYPITRDGKLAKPEDIEYKSEKVLAFSGLSGEGVFPVREIKVRR